MSDDEATRPDHPAAYRAPERVFPGQDDTLVFTLPDEDGNASYLIPREGDEPREGTDAWIQDFFYTRLRNAYVVGEYFDNEFFQTDRDYRVFRAALDRFIADHFPEAADHPDSTTYRNLVVYLHNGLNYAEMRERIEEMYYEMGEELTEKTSDVEYYEEREQALEEELADTKAALADAKAALAGADERLQEVRDIADMWRQRASAE